MSKTKPSDFGVSWPAKVIAPDTNVEVSHTIIERVDDWGMYSIDALTKYGGWLRMLAVDCGEYQRAEIVRRMDELKEGWKHKEQDQLHHLLKQSLDWLFH